MLNASVKSHGTCTNERKEVQLNREYEILFTGPFGGALLTSASEHRIQTNLLFQGAVVGFGPAITISPVVCDLGGFSKKILESLSMKDKKLLRVIIGHCVHLKFTLDCCLGGMRQPRA